MLPMVVMYENLLVLINDDDVCCDDYYFVDALIDVVPVKKFRKI